MSSGIETNGAYLSPECNEVRSTFEMVPPNDWSTYRTNCMNNMTNLNSSYDPRMVNLLPQLGIENRQCPVFDMNVIMYPQFMQPHMMQPHNMQSNQYRYWDGYWKNYWQDYYRRADSFNNPRFDARPNFDGDNRTFEREMPGNFDHPDLQERPSRRNRPYRRFDRPDRLDRPDRPDRADRQRRPGETNPPRSFEQNTESGRVANILSSARDSVGQQLFKFIPGTPGRLGCAASVSAALSKAGFSYAKHAGVGGLSEILQRNGWTKHEGIQNAQPGDVVIVARNARWAQGGGSAHIGIVGENGKVYHNSSGRQQWVEDSLQKVFGGGMMRFILRPPKT